MLYDLLWKRQWEIQNDTMVKLSFKQYILIVITVFLKFHGDIQKSYCLSWTVLRLAFVEWTRTLRKRIWCSHTSSIDRDLRTFSERDKDTLQDLWKLTNPDNFVTKVSSIYSTLETLDPNRILKKAWKHIFSENHKFDLIALLALA